MGKKMIITTPTNLPSIISTATTWESAALLLSKYCLDLQTEYNNTAAEADQKALIDIQTVITGDEPTATITLTGLELYTDITTGKLQVGKNQSDPFEDSSYVAGTGYPWIGISAIDTLVNVFRSLFISEKSTTNNPDDLDRMTVSIAQDTDQNSPEFTLDITLVLPIIVTGSDQSINFVADEYLVGNL
jgi:hypothetical protein